MNSNEDCENMLANIQIGEPARPLPEQAVEQTPASIPRPISFLSLIHQWQPMGIRVIVNLPFISDDKSTLFCIRNGPYIPDWRSNFHASSWTQAAGSSPVVNSGRIGVWAFNCMNAVVQTSPISNLSYPSNYPVHISYYDSPPFLSQMALTFRRWRGDMQYRIRVVAGFVTQGYLIVAPIKNTPLAPQAIDPFKKFYTLGGTDVTSYRPYMQNSYIMSDTSYYRHVEVSYPYEYPTPWYDQYQWIANRLSVDIGGSGATPPAWDNVVYPNAFQEPFADNWLAVLVRGTLEPTRDTAQITFELEYRAMEGFQFSDPGLVPKRFNFTSQRLQQNPQQYPYTVLTIPSTTYESNGVNFVRKKAAKSTAAVAAKRVAARPIDQANLLPRVGRDASPKGTHLEPRTAPHSEDETELYQDDRESRSRIRRDIEFSY